MIILKKFSRKQLKAAEEHAIEISESSPREAMKLLADINKERIKEIKAELNRHELKKHYLIKRKQKGSSELEFSTNYTLIEKCDIIIVCLPTPLKNKKTPDLRILLQFLHDAAS